jgi:hypothetical protein
MLFGCGDLGGLTLRTGTPQGLTRSTGRDPLVVISTLGYGYTR